MGALYDVLESLASEHDPELIDGFHRYEALLETLLTPAQIESYAAYIRQTGEVRIFEEMNPAEIASLPADIAAIAASVLGDINISMENRRVVALLSQRGEEEIIPDFQDGPVVQHNNSV